jgi:hypothetical protein
MAVATSYIQTHGVQQGVWFDMDTMHSLLDSAGFKEASRIFAGLSSTMPGLALNATCDSLDNPFLSGRCAMTMHWSYFFKVAPLTPLASSCGLPCCSMVALQEAALQTITSLKRQCPDISSHFTQGSQSLALLTCLWGPAPCYTYVVTCDCSWLACTKESSCAQQCWPCL